LADFIDEWFSTPVSIFRYFEQGRHPDENKQISNTFSILLIIKRLCGIFEFFKHFSMAKRRKRYIFWVAESHLLHDKKLSFAT